MAQAGGIVVVGSINADLTARVARHPSPGETLIGSGGEITPGGKGANQALAAALANKVGMIARLYSTTGRVNARELAGSLGAHPFVVEKTAKIARRWTGDSISRAVILVADLDAAVKGQGGNPAFEVESAVHRISRLAG